MKWHLFFCNAVLVVLLCLGLIACKEVKKEKDIAEAVASTTKLIDENITTEINEGVVTMKGEVADEATKTAAVNAVRHIEGVKSIKNQLTVKAAASNPPQMTETDFLLKTGIDAMLKLQNIPGVEITVLNGEVTLSGQVNSTQEVAIMKIARDAQPSKLNNYLRVADKEN